MRFHFGVLCGVRMASAFHDTRTYNRVTDLLVKDRHMNVYIEVTYIGAFYLQYLIT